MLVSYLACVSMSKLCVWMEMVSKLIVYHDHVIIIRSDDQMALIFDLLGGPSYYHGPIVKSSSAEQGCAISHSK